MKPNTIRFVPILQVGEDILDRVRDWRNSPQIRAFMKTCHLISMEEHSKWFESIKNGNDMQVWVVYVNGIPIGVANLIHMDYMNKITDWGFYIGENNYRGKGLSKVILFSLMVYVFEKLNFRKMYTTVLGNNLIAIKLYEKMGFKKEGRLREHLFRNGEYIDVFYMGILGKEWDNVKRNVKSKNNLSEVEITWRSSSG